MVGRLGGLRVLVLENHRAADGDHTHSLMFSAAPQYDGAYSRQEPVEASPERGTACNL